MKRYVGVLFAIGALLVGIVMASRKYSAKAVEADRIEDAARIRTAYLERVGWIRSNPDEKAYKSEVTTFLRWYFQQVNEHLNRFGGNRDFDDYLLELDARAERGGDPQAEEKKAYYEYTKKVFDLMRGGSYEPAWSATDKGMRLDVLSTQPVVSGGQQQVRYQLALWGPQRELREESKNLKKMVTSAAFSVTWKLYDEKGKLIGEMSASGDPSNKVDFPERFIAEFPPQMVLGHYDIDLLPANTKNLEIVFSVNSRAASGGDIYANYSWKLEAPEGWKLRPGEEWKGAEESIRSPEEINPSKAGEQAAAN